MNLEEAREDFWRKYARVRDEQRQELVEHHVLANRYLRELEGEPRTGVSGWDENPTIANSLASIAHSLVTIERWLSEIAENTEPDWRDRVNEYADRAKGA